MLGKVFRDLEITNLPESQKTGEDAEDIYNYGILLGVIRPLEDLTEEILVLEMFREELLLKENKVITFYIKYGIINVCVDAKLSMYQKEDMEHRCFMFMSVLPHLSNYKIKF